MTAVLAAPCYGAVTWDQVSGQEVAPAEHLIRYGQDSDHQFGELRLPEGSGPHAVAIVIHGGCWGSKFDYRHITGASAALTRSGIATWTIEYRRIGDPGGGWPGTFIDVASASDHLRTLATQYPLDLSRVVAIGHSAGGQLALWLAARSRLPPGSPIHTTDPLPLRGVVALAGISDLRKFGRGTENCNKAVAALLGGKSSSVPERYDQASPIEMLPLGIAQVLVHGTQDRIVPVEQSRRFAAIARGKGDDSTELIIKGAGHFDLIAPFAPAWASVERAVHRFLEEPGSD